jgi:hypothetical protein
MSIPSVSVLLFWKGKSATICPQFVANRSNIPLRGHEAMSKRGVIFLDPEQ